MAGSSCKEQSKSCISLFFNINILMRNVTYDVEKRIGIGTSVTKTDCVAEVGLIICF